MYVQGLREALNLVFFCGRSKNQLDRNRKTQDQVTTRCFVVVIIVAVIGTLLPKLGLFCLLFYRRANLSSRQ